MTIENHAIENKATDNDEYNVVEALECCERWFAKHSPTSELIGGWGYAEHPLLEMIRTVLAAHRATVHHNTEASEE